MTSWHGQGIAGRYGGLPDAFSRFLDSQIVILPVPFDRTTTYQHGADKGPAALIEASRNMELYDIEMDSEVYRRGICTLPPIEAADAEEMRRQVYAKVLDALKAGKFVVTLGGEHSISYAPIKAHGEFYSSISVLQLDAHADLQEAYEGNPWSHASVMARVKELEAVNSIVSVGIRSMSQEEVPSLNRPNTFFSHELEANSDWMNEAIDLLSDKVYITLDLDVFDSAIMPSTGTPEPGGLNWPQVTRFLKLVTQKKQVVGFDVVELCPQPPLIAPDFLAAKLVYKLLSYKFHERLP